MRNRIIALRNDELGGWTAWFDDAPHEAFGGEFGTSAVQRLIDACSERSIIPESVRLIEHTSQPVWFVFTAKSSNIVTNRAQLRAVFGYYSRQPTCSGLAEGIQVGEITDEAVLFACLRSEQRGRRRSHSFE